jgi:hypothetical protein
MGCIKITIKIDHNRIICNIIVKIYPFCFRLVKDFGKKRQFNFISYSALISDFLLTINNENFVCNQTFTISSHPSWKHLFDALTELKMG